MEKQVHLFSKLRKRKCFVFRSMLLKQQENPVIQIGAKHLGADLIKVCCGGSLCVFPVNR